MSDRLRFNGHVAIVTGAGTGIGRTLSLLLAEEGANVVVAARRKDLVEAVAAEIGLDRALPVVADVTDEASVSSMASQVLERFGQIDVLFNNAAQPGTDHPIWEQTLDNWNQNIAVNLTAPMLCTREVVSRSMLERRSGAIINFSSVASWNGWPRKSHYTAAKAGVRALTKTLALECGDYGIRVNCIVPGMVATEAYKGWIQRISAEAGISYDEQERQILANNAIKKVNTTEDVARAAMFLASPEAATITGQSLVVDGGGVFTG